MHRGCGARIVDHVADLAVIAQCHGDDVMKPHLRSFRRLDRAGQIYVRISEHAVNAQPPRLVASHSIRDLV